MAQFIRKIFSKLQQQLSRTTNQPRKNLRVPISVSFAPEMITGPLSMKREILSIQGETKDFSANGIAFIVDSIRLREHYLVGESRILDAVITLPEATVRMKIIGQRYEPLDQHLSITKYLIGAAILSMEPIEKDKYEDYLKNSGKSKKTITTGGLGLEITKN